MSRKTRKADAAAQQADAELDAQWNELRRRLGV